MYTIWGQIQKKNICHPKKGLVLLVLQQMFDNNDQSYYRMSGPWIDTIELELEHICSGQMITDLLSKWFVKFGADQLDFADVEIKDLGKSPNKIKSSRPVSCLVLLAFISCVSLALNMFCLQLHFIG